MNDCIRINCTLLIVELQGNNMRYHRFANADDCCNIMVCFTLYLSYAFYNLKTKFFVINSLNPCNVVLAVSTMEIPIV